MIKGRTLTVVPHGILHYVPFGALHDGQKYLIENAGLRVMPSASVLAFLKTNKVSKPGQLLAFGNPDLGDAKLDLPNAEKEAITVSSMLPGSKVLTRKDASKAALKDYGNGFAILHFATHGEFSADSPLSSGLLLSKTATDDGRLTVSDLYGMRLDTDLVTLSACETGLGKVANGDDVVGLTRGFLFAGARSIVSSLWQVDDAATEKLMISFYKHMGRTDRREALRMAQLETMKTYQHPFYWAAFQITGNVR